MTTEELEAAEQERLDALAAEEEAERQAAIARGDIIEEEKQPELDADVLADIAADIEVEAQPVAEKKDDGLIPRARFNEINEENKALKERLAAMETAKVATTDPIDNGPTEYEKLETLRDELQLKADQLMVDCDVEGRKPVLKQIRDIDRALAKAELMYEVRQEMAQKETVSTMKQVIDSAYDAYEFLNPQSDSFDADAVAAINSRQAVLIQSGQSAALALQNAVAEKGPKFAKLLGLETKQADTSDADKVRESRDKAAKEKAAAASLSQPASLPSKSDKASFEIDAKTLTYKQLMSLPEAERAKAMGDTL